MNELIIFISIAVLFLFVLFYWALRTRGPAIGSRALSDVQETFAMLDLEPPPWALAEKIFSLQDWDFVLGKALLPDRRAFLGDRTAIALFWLRRIRAQVARLMGFYRRAVRGNVHLSAAVEVRLAANYVLFLLVYDVLLGWIWVGGPFHARKLARYATHVADQLWVLSEQLLAHVDPDLLLRAGADGMTKSS
jgi:hypothetical protein